jgi:hypothetical protein
MEPLDLGCVTNTVLISDDDDDDDCAFRVAERQYSFTEKQRYDGWFNNLAHPDWGSVGE